MKHATSPFLKEDELGGWARVLLMCGAISLYLIIRVGIAEVDDQHPGFSWFVAVPVTFILVMFGYLACIAIRWVYQGFRNDALRRDL